MAPLVAERLWFYLRNRRFRLLSCLCLPIAAFMAVATGQPRQPGGSLFVGVLGGLGIVGFLGTGRIAVNQYGYMGKGFRRFLLLPEALGASLHAGSYAALFLGSMGSRRRLCCGLFSHPDRSMPESF